MSEPSDLIKSLMMISNALRPPRTPTRSTMRGTEYEGYGRGTGRIQEGYNRGTGRVQEGYRGVHSLRSKRFRR